MNPMLFPLYPLRARYPEEPFRVKLKSITFKSDGNKIELLTSSPIELSALCDFLIEKYGLPK